MRQTIFITGASSGLGKETAKRFANQGWTVIAAMRHPEKETELNQLPHVHLVKLDLTDPAQIAAAVEAAEAIAPVDVLLNNAAYGLIGPFEGITEAQLVQQINTNFLGTLLVTKAFLPSFRARKQGTILTVTSSTANISYPFVSVYAATKSALQNWTEGMSYELGPFGIRIKTIVPAYMQTSFGVNAQFATHPAYEILFNQYLNAMKQDASAKRDTPEAIAAVIYETVLADKDQLHHTAGDLATQEYQWLKEEGIEAVMQTMQKRFF